MKRVLSAFVHVALPCAGSNTGRYRRLGPAVFGCPSGVSGSARRGAGVDTVLPAAQGSIRHTSTQAGCEWSADTFVAAAAVGCVAQLEWLAEQGCPAGVGEGGLWQGASGAVLRRCRARCRVSRICRFAPLSM